jgi:RNA polymerase sigma-70 factor, ECF subfamily
MTRCPCAMGRPQLNYRHLGDSLADDFNETWRGLMAQSQLGDKAAYATLLEALYPFLLAYVRRRVSNLPDTEEIVQTVLLRVHVSRHTYNPAYPLEPWLYTISRNVLSDHMKSHARAGLPSKFEHDESSQGAEDPVFEMIALERAVKALPESQRVALELMKFSGLSVADAAKKVGVSVPALKVRAHRAYDTIKKAVGITSDSE